MDTSAVRYSENLGENLDRENINQHLFIYVYVHKHLLDV